MSYQNYHSYLFKLLGAGARNLGARHSKGIGTLPLALKQLNLIDLISITGLAQQHATGIHMFTALF